MKTDFEKFAISNGISSSKLDAYGRYVQKNTYGQNPVILEEREMNVIAIDVISRLTYDRILFISGAIDEDTAKIINSQMMYLNSISEDPLKLFINSPGGSVLDGLAIYDVMNWVACDVETYVMGMAASMGSVLLSSGTKGKRFALPNSRVMIHQPMSGAAPGTRESDFAIEYEELKKCKATLYRILSANTGKSVEEIEKDAERDCWFSAEEAIGYGLVDEIVQNSK